MDKIPEKKAITRTSLTKKWRVLGVTLRASISCPVGGTRCESLRSNLVYCDNPKSTSSIAKTKQLNISAGNRRRSRQGKQFTEYVKYFKDEYINEILCDTIELASLDLTNPCGSSCDVCYRHLQKGFTRTSI